MNIAELSFYAFVASALGKVGIVWSGKGGRRRIRRILLPRQGIAMVERIRQECPNAVPAATAGGITERIADFLAGKGADLSAEEVDLGGSNAFTRRVLTACRAIPRGRVMTYGALAAAAGVPGGARAVGNVMAGNPLALIVPCHRVIRSGGALGGFGGGLAMKRALLEGEGVGFDKRGRILACHIL